MTFALALGLGSGLAWGLADFLGGLKSRKLALVTVLVLSQGTGLVLIASIVLLRGEASPPAEYLVYAALSGIAGVLGLAAFYRGLAIGAMAVVAPISATAAAIPVTVGILSGERPGAIQVAGIGLVLAGVALTSRETPPEEGRTAPRVAAGVGLALLAALGFGSFFVAMDAASEGDVFWAILANRATAVAVLTTVALATRPSLVLDGGDWRALVSVGALDITANGLFAVASTEGLVSLVAVLASLYPVVTIVLARLVLSERVGRGQQAGIVATLVGVTLITAG